MANIVWLASYPKSGNTWVRAFLHNLLAGGQSPAPINDLRRFCEDESKPRWYEPYADGRDVGSLSAEEIAAIRPRVHRDIAASRPGSVFVKTHNFMGHYRGHPLHALEVTGGAIYIVRNPLDVVLSAADHFGMSIDETIEFMNEQYTGTPGDEANVASVISSWSMHVQSWTQGDPGVLVLRYEDLYAKPLKHFGSIMSFIKLPKDVERLKRAIRHSSFDVLSRQESAGGFIERSPHSARFFRRGRVNEWRTALTREQARRIVEHHREQMARFKYIPANLRD